jgi:hypothetical protein
MAASFSTSQRKYSKKNSFSIKQTSNLQLQKLLAAQELYNFVAP